MAKKVKLAGDAAVAQKKAAVSSAKALPSKAGPSGSSSSSKLARIASLEQQLSPAGADLNPLVDILELLGDAQSAKVQAAAAHALHNLFSSLIRQGRVIGKVRGEESQAVKAVRDWVRERWIEYTDRLLSLLCSPEQAIASPTLNILMSLLRTTSEYFASLREPPTYAFDARFWRKILEALLQSPQPVSPAIKAEFSIRYLNHFDDIRYYFLKASSELAKQHPQDEGLKSALLYFLESMTTMPSDEGQIDQFLAGKPKDKKGLAVKAAQAKIKTKKRKRPKLDDGSTGIFDDSDDSSDEDEGDSANPAVKIKVGQHDLLQLVKHRKVFSDGWIGLLAMSLSEEDIKTILVMLHRQVMPHLLDPSILIDFLADCTDYGGTVALLALNGLFTLITKHRLDYPNFYLNLYRLLDSQALHVRYRPRFLRMLDTFLSSTHLPIALVASFIKRLARLALFAPPAAIISVMPFIYNLLKRHPACMVLIHSSELPEPGSEYIDPFNENEPDPLKSNAIDSSLWEIVSLRRHYLASVSTLAKIFGEAFTKPNYDMEDFLDHAYSSLYETETSRPIKKPPAMNTLPSGSDIAYIFPKAVRDASEEEVLQRDTKCDVVGRLWQF